MVQPLIIDVIGHIITYATPGAINAIARSCHACAALVRGRASDIADQWTIEYEAGEHNDAFIRRLPNGTLHGHMISCPSGQLIMRWDRGLAMSWEYQCTDDNLVGEIIPAKKRGHRNTPHVLSDRHHDVKHDHFIIVGDRVASASGTIIRIDVVTGHVRISANKVLKTSPPWILRGYLVDGEIVPSVINPWVDAILAGVDTRACKPTPTRIIGYDDSVAVTRISNESGLVIIKNV